MLTATPKERSARNTTILRLTRKLHLYIGVFIAPALLFFAFTGAMQTLNLHEASGTSYTPPGWLERLAQLHKNQNIQLRRPRPASPDAPRPPKADTAAVNPAPTPQPKPEETLGTKLQLHLPEKLFFLLVSLGLFTSTVTGLFMAYKYERGKLLLTALLLAGILLPLALLPF